MAIKFLSGLNLSDVTAGSLLKLDSNGKIVAAVDGTDYNTATSEWSVAGQGGVKINKDVRIGTFSSDVLPEARLHVYEYQTTTPKLLIEDGNTGDASMQFKISTQQYTMGIDNSNSDKFVLAASSALGTTNVLEIANNGASAFQKGVSFNEDVTFANDVNFNASGYNFTISSDTTTRTTLAWRINSVDSWAIETNSDKDLTVKKNSLNTTGDFQIHSLTRITDSLTVNTNSYTNTITTGHSGTLNLIDTKTLILDDSFGTSDGRVFGVLQPAPFKPSDVTLGDSAYSSTATGSYVTNNYPNVKGESDATGIMNHATFTFAEALAQAETLGGRLPTLEEIMSGVGRGSGQSYDNEYIWTQTKAGHGRYWVARGSAVTTNDAKVVDINSDTAPEYRMRIFYDISKDNMPVYYDNSSNIRATSIKAENDDGIALRALDGDIGITVKDDGNVKFNQYTAGILKTDASGNISLDTSTYLTSVDWDDIGSINDTININSTTQIGQGDTETLVSFQNSGTERGRFEVDDSADSYFVATGFKTTGSSTGLLKSDGTIDTSTYATSADINSFIEIGDVSTYLSTNNYVTTSYTGFAASSHTHSAADITSGTLGADRLPWAENDGFTGTYSIVWRATNTPYTSSWLQVRGSDDTLLTRNIAATGTLSTTGVIEAADQISVKNRTAVSVGHWSNSGSSTGAIKITLPGSHGSNWSMIVLRITAYEYNSTAHTIYYVSGHDWTSGWYNNGVTKIGNGNKSIKLGYDDNKDYVILGGVTDTWSYGHVTVDVMAHPSFYSSNMDITTGWDVRQTTDLSGITTQSVTNKRVLTTSDEGTGNGIDADTVDGKHASDFVAVSGDAMTGALSVSTTGVAATPTVSLTNTSSATFNHTINALAPNLTAGENNIFIIGKEGNTKNSGYIGYTWNADAGNSNVLTFGHWGSDNLMNLTGDGKLGIGTKAPNGKVTVFDDMISSSSTTTDITISKTSYGSINFQGADQDSGATNTKQQAITWQVNDFGSGNTDYGVQAAIAVSNNGSVGTQMGFFTSNSYSGGPGERMRITAAGDVGIGTASPSGKLHLEGNFESGKALVIKGTYGTDTEYYFRTHGVNSEILALYAAGVRVMNWKSDRVDTNFGLNVLGGEITTGTSNHLVIGSSVQIGQGDEDPVIEFKYGSTSLGKIDQFGDIHAGGFKVSGTTGFLKSDGSVDTTSYQAAGSYLTSISSSDVTGALGYRPASGAYGSWSSITNGNSGDWFPLFQMDDGGDGSALVIFKTYAHDSVVFTVSRGYNGSNNNSINVLNSVNTPNSGYATVESLRVRNDGWVEAKLVWTTGPTVQASIQVITGDDNEVSIESDLETTQQTATVNHTVNVNKRGLLHGYTIESTGDITSGAKLISDGKLYIGTTDATATAVTALFLGAAGEVKKRALGTAAFSATGDFAAASHTHSYLPLSGGTVTGMTIFEDGLRIGTGNHYTDGRASITFGEGNPTSDSMYIEYDGENLNGDSNAIIFGSAKDGVGDVFRVTYGGSVLIGSNAVATESYVTTQISNLVDSAPAALDTLNELAAALGDDANFSTTMSTALGNRLRIDVNNQSLTSTQKANGRTNLGLGSAATSASTDFVAVSGDTMTGILKLDEGVTNHNWSTFTHLEGANTLNNPSGTGGAIRIELPTSEYNTNTMMSMTVKVYEYSTGKSFTLFCGGYNYQNGSWYNTFATLLGDNERGDVPVYFGRSDSRNIIWIGNSDWSWSYPNVWVTDFQSGHTQGQDWNDGWNIVFDEEDRTNVTASQTAHKQIHTGNISSYTNSYLPLAGGTMTGGLTTNSAITSTRNGTAFVMDGGSSAEGIRMKADTSSTYPVFLRSTNPSGGGETSAWIFKEHNTAWGIWHNNPINTIDFTRSPATGIANDVGGGDNTVMIRLDMQYGHGRFAGNVYSSGGDSTQWNTAYGWGNHASAGYITDYTVTAQDVSSAGAMIKSGEETSTAMKKFYTTLTNNDDWENSPISILERGNVGSAQSAGKYSPNLNFHWTSRVSNSLWMDYTGVLHWGSYSSSGVPASDGTFKTGSLYASTKTVINGTHRGGSLQVNDYNSTSEGVRVYGYSDNAMLSLISRYDQANGGLFFKRGGNGSESTIGQINFVSNQFRIDATVGSLLIETSGVNALSIDSSQNTTLTGDLILPNKITHSGDGDTYIKFDDNRIRLVAGNVTKFDSDTIYTGTVQSVSGTGTVSGLTLTSDDDSVDPTLTLGGSITTPVSGDWWNDGFAKVQTDGVMEIGKYIDFHDSDTETDDFSYRLTASNTALTFSGAINIPEYIYHNGDSNTYIRFTGDRIRIVAGGTTKFDSNSTYLTSYTETDTLASVTGRGASTTTTLSVRRVTARDITPESDRTYNLGQEETRWRIVYCETLDSAGQHESNLQDEEQPISQYATGTVLSWKHGKNRPCTQYADHMRMGIAVEGQDSPLIQGAEPVLVTGLVEEGDYLVTSEKEGHAVAVPRNIVKEQMLFDCVIGKALESGDGDSHLIKTWINI